MSRIIDLVPPQKRLHSKYPPLVSGPDIHFVETNLRGLAVSPTSWAFLTTPDESQYLYLSSSYQDSGGLGKYTCTGFVHFSVQPIHRSPGSFPPPMAYGLHIRECRPGLPELRYYSTAMFILQNPRYEETHNTICASMHQQIQSTKINSHK